MKPVNIDVPKLIVDSFKKSPISNETVKGVLLNYNHINDIFLPCIWLMEGTIHETS